MGEYRYIIEFYPQNGTKLVSALSFNPIKDLIECANQYAGGIRGATIRPKVM